MCALKHAHTIQPHACTYAQVKTMTNLEQFSLYCFSFQQSLAQNNQMPPIFAEQIISTVPPHDLA